MLPELFLKRMQGMLGDEYEEFVESFGRERYQALRLNALKINGNQKSEVKIPFHLSPVAWEENGYYYEKEDQPGKHPYHEAGVYYIQEPSAMAPVPMLEVKPGDRVLDLCAAPGGKSTQIAAKLKGEGLLVCNEINPQRAKILSENIERMGVCNACVTNEAPERLAGFFPEYFDKILVDAPCSGEGMFRKNEDACDEWSPENVEMCAMRQDGILDEAAKMLRKGGRLVYSTCTFAEAEDEGSVERFAERHPEFKLIEMKRLWPHKIKGEGHFAAVLVKDGEADEAYRSMPVNGLEKGVPVKELGDYVSFVDEIFAGQDDVKDNTTYKDVNKDKDEDIDKAANKDEDKDKIANKDVDKDTYIDKDIYNNAGDHTLNISCRLKAAAKGDSSIRFSKFGDNVYLIPEEMPSVKGLKVLRTGLHIGTLKKNRFEPAHALALALNPKDAKYAINLDSSDRRIMQYLNGQTFPAEGEKGWYLICVDGFGIGWGKLAGGMMKNHYPKGLRINL